MSNEWGAGDRSKWSDHGIVLVGEREYPLIYGEHPHSRSDNHHYVDTGAEEPVGFSGHRILIGIKLETFNYYKDSYLSGDEIRGAGTGYITADGVVVFEFGFREIEWGLAQAASLISRLREHASGWIIKRDRERLIGRPVFYKETPAVVDGLIVDQGCLMLRTVDGKPFPKPVWTTDDEWESESRIKVEVLSPHICWFRNAS